MSYFIFLLSRYTRNTVAIFSNTNCCNWNLQNLRQFSGEYLMFHLLLCSDYLLCNRTFGLRPWSVAVVVQVHIMFDGVCKCSIDFKAVCREEEETDGGLGCCFTVRPASPLCPTVTGPRGRTSELNRRTVGLVSLSSVQMYAPYPCAHTCFQSPPCRWVQHRHMLQSSDRLYWWCDCCKVNARPVTDLSQYRMQQNTLTQFIFQ